MLSYFQKKKKKPTSRSDFLAGILQAQKAKGRRESKGEVSSVEGREEEREEVNVIMFLGVDLCIASVKDELKLK